MQRRIRIPRIVAEGLIFLLAIAAPATAAEEIPPAPDSLTRSTAELVELRIATSRALAGVRVTAEEPEGTQGVVNLIGSVRDADQERRALRIARRTRGVKEVHNALKVDPKLPVPTSRPDPEIVRDVAIRLAHDDVLGGKASESWVFGWQVQGAEWTVDVDVDDGDVSLTGTVLLPERVLDAVRAARASPGVRSVRADLELHSTDGPDWEHYP